MRIKSCSFYREYPIKNGLHHTIVMRLRFVSITAFKTSLASISAILYLILFDWNESSPEGSDDEEDETPNLLDPLSNAEVNSSVLLVQYFILVPFL